MRSVWRIWLHASRRGSRAARRSAWHWRALLLRPRVILADEPTASLDDAASAAALTLLRERAQAAGATLVIATHDARVLQAVPGAQLLAMGGDA